jgi:hypothetical protein
MLSPDLFRDQRQIVQAITEYQCETGSRYPIATVLPALDVRYRQWQNGAWKEPNDPVSGTSFAADSLTENRKGVVVRGTLPFDPQAQYGMYLLRFTGRPGELAPAVDSLSTDSDADLTSFDRTYRFSWLTEQLVRVHMARWVAQVPFVFTVRYR